MASLLGFFPPRGTKKDAPPLTFSLIWLAGHFYSIAWSIVEQGFTAAVIMQLVDIQNLLSHIALLLSFVHVSDFFRMLCASSVCRIGALNDKYVAALEERMHSTNCRWLKCAYTWRLLSFFQPSSNSDPLTPQRPSFLLQLRKEKNNKMYTLTV